MKMKTLAIALSLLLVLVWSCHSTKQMTVAASGEMLSERRWKLVELNGTAVTSGNAYLLFNAGDTGRLAGNGGCNMLRGRFELSGNNSIIFSPMAITRMACSSESREVEFIDGLTRVDSWRIIDNQLLLNNGQNLLARLVASDENSKLNGSWELNYISVSGISFDAMFPGKKPTIMFNPSTTEATGNGGCNNYRAEVILNGNKISFGNTLSTKMACKGSGEPVYFETLKRITSYSTSNDNNTLTLLVGDIVVMRFTKRNN